MAFSFTGKACVAFHSYVSSVRCMHPLKNNPTFRGGGLVAPDVGLFREHEVRDACVQTDPWVSGTLGYASRGPTITNQSEGQYSLLFIWQTMRKFMWTAKYMTSFCSSIS